MKKIISLILLSAFALVSFAQTTPQAMTGTGDTLKNAGTDYVILRVDGTYNHVSVQATVRELSGTTAGSGRLYGSVDGLNYQLATGANDTMALADQATNTHIWVLDNVNYLYYKVIFQGIGTMSGLCSGTLYAEYQQGKHATANMLSRWAQVKDTVTNTATKYVTLQVKGAYRTVTIQALVTKLSGTAAGTVTLQGSNDGTNFVTVSSSYSTAQTLSCSNQAANSKIFIVTGSPYAYYRLSYTGSGTMSATLRGYLLPNK